MVGFALLVMLISVRTPFYFKMMLDSRIVMQNTAKIHQVAKIEKFTKFKSKLAVFDQHLSLREDIGKSWLIAESQI